jgi:hypothetical protein
MSTRVRVIHWKASEANELLAALRSAGYAVDYDERPDYRIITAVRESSPSAIVIDLSRMPSHGREVAVFLRGRKDTRSIPLVFVNGDDEKVEAIRALLPDAAYTTTAGVGNAVRSAIAEPATAPVTPPQMMDRYQGKTAAQKLGIAAGSRVALIEPPADYARLLGELPSGAQLAEDGGAAEVTLWFARDLAGCRAAFPEMRRLAARTKLWILWQKGSKSGLSPNLLRETATSLGMVDYKICAVNERWSGMAFAISGRTAKSPARSRAGTPRKSPPRRA